MSEDVDAAFDSVMGDSSQCKSMCSDSFPLHTYDKPSNLEACQRGCRLFAICEWVEDDDDFNNTLDACSDACTEAYNSTDGQQLSSCVIGCKSAVHPAEERKTKLEKEDPHIQLVVGDPIHSPSHLFFSSLMMDPVDDFFSQVSQHPLMMSADNSMQRMMNYVGQFLQMDSLMSSLMGDDGTSDEIIIISFNSPEINTQHPLEKQVKLNTDENPVHMKTTLNDKVESNLQTNLYGHDLMNLKYRSDGKGDLWFDYYDDFDHFENPVARDHLQEWWDCFTKKAGLPELTLLFFWLSTMILLIMCATMQFPSKNDKNKLSISGDLAYIRETKGRVPDFLRVYGHPDIVQFTEVKAYRPDEKVPLRNHFVSG